MLDFKSMDFKFTWHIKSRLCYVPCTTLGSGPTIMNKVDKDPICMELIFGLGSQGSKYNK